MAEFFTPTGVEGLDLVLGGGFPRGSIIILAGNPGTGKTIFSAQFLYHGAVNYGENGVYVSLAEDRETFIRNMKNVGFDFERLEREGKISLLDFLITKEESFPAIVNAIAREVSKLSATRLVVDSYSALAQSFERMFDARIFLNVVLGKIARMSGCTTLIIVEVPFGQERLGLGVEEFVADGILHFRSRRIADRLHRDIIIRKMRGIPIKQDLIGFTLHGGFKAFPPFRIKPTVWRERFKPMPNPPGRFTTCSEDFDNLLNGGWPKTSTALLEIGKNISIPEYHLLINSTFWNFLANEAGVIVVPSSGVDYKLVYNRAAESGLPKEILEKCLRICTFLPLAAEKKWLIKFSGEDLKEDFSRYVEMAADLNKQTGKPVLHIIGVDMLIAHYGLKEAIKIVNLGATMVRENGDLELLILKPGYPVASDILNAVVDVHLKLVREHGALILYGLKPRTELNVVEVDVSSGYLLPKFTPVH